MAPTQKPSEAFHPENNEILQMASMFEDDFSLDWLVEISGRKASQILAELDESVKREDLNKKGPYVFCFKDQRKKNAIRETIPSEQRKLLSQRIVNFLIGELQENNGKTLTLSQYLLRIDKNNQENCFWLLRAGDFNRRNNRYEEALLCYAKILNDLSGIYGLESNSLFVDTAIKYSKVSTARHDSDRVISLLHEASTRAKELKNPAQEALLEMHLAKNEWLRSRYTSALDHFEKGWSIAKDLNEPKLMRSANVFSAFFLFWQGRFKEVVSTYEKFVPEIQRYPQLGFPLLAAIMVGTCYGMIGETSQGLGLIDAIRTYCKDRDDRYLEAQAGISMAIILIDIHQIDEALKHLNLYVEEANRVHNDWIGILGKLQLAFAYYLIGQNDKASFYLLDFLERSKNVHVDVWPYPYLLELCWAIERGKLPSINDLSLEQEANRILGTHNVFMKGVAYRYLALLQYKRRQPAEGVIESLNLSLKSLKESGHMLELAKTEIQLSRAYKLIGNEKEAKNIMTHASRILSSHNEALIPEDLKSIVKKSSFSAKSLLKEILKLSQEIVAIRDQKHLAQSIISTINKITGAERGAIFLLKDNKTSGIYLRASKNLTPDQINHSTFGIAMKIIKDVASKGKGRIFRINPSNKRLSAGIISSCICVPMVLREKLVGVLYHDNCLLKNLFRDSDLELLAHFAAQAAIAFENARIYDEIKQLNQRLHEEKLYYKEEHLQSINFEDIIGESPAIIGVLEKVDQVAKAETAVLIMGETGVGKELVARAIHRHSSRRDKPFIRILCNAIPDSLIPSELFGHEKGAFTGAISRRIGRFELADEGTLFLDEIGDLPLEIQVRLLRVLQNKEFERVGGNETICSDFRLIVATNRDLKQEVETGRFRADLYYRLNVFPIHVPPLRERKEDIPLLAKHFLNIHATKKGKKFEGIPESEMNKLIQYDWPGNVRELENIIERGTLLSSDPFFETPDLAFGRPALAPSRYGSSLDENERRHILLTLAKTNWKIRGPGGAAEVLKIHPSTLSFRMKKLAIQRPIQFARKRNAYRVI